MELSIEDQDLDQRSKIIMLAVAFVQGLLLYVLHETLLKNLGQNEILYVLNLLVIFVPTTVVLSFRQSQNHLPYWLFIAGFSLLLIAIGWQQGSLINEHNKIHHFFGWFFDSGNFFIILLLWFKVCFFLKGYLYENNLPASYPTLFGFSWHNYLTISLSCVFTWIFFGILMLCAGLFKVVEINFFKELFEQEWFLYPVLSMVFGYGIVLFRTQINAVGTIQRILRILLKTLLPILIAVAFMFVVVLPFTGVALIWEKGFGSGYILGFVYVTLFFFNAVYQDGSEDPYNEKLSEKFKYSLIVLLVFCALCFYGFGLRVNQYGWTEERLWLAILTIIASTFVILYSVIILLKKDDWSEYFGKANTGMAIVVLVILIAILTPLMDLKKISANNQYHRLINGEVSADEFDFVYMSQLGKYGKEKLVLLREFEDIKSNPKLLSKLELALKKKLNRSNNKLTVAQRKLLVDIYPQGREVDEEVWKLLKYQTNKDCKKRNCFILLQDLNLDGQEEYLFFKNTYSNDYSITLIKKRKDKYRASRTQYGIKSSSDVLEKVKQKQISLKPSAWQDLYIDGKLIPLEKM